MHASTCLHVRFNPHLMHFLNQLMYFAGMPASTALGPGTEPGSEGGTWTGTGVGGTPPPPPPKN